MFARRHIMQSVNRVAIYEYIWWNFVAFLLITPLGPKVGPLRHIIEMYLEVPSSKTRMMRNKWKKFRKDTWRPELCFVSGPKITRKLGIWGDIRNTSKSSSNWHVNQNLCETSGNFFFENEQRPGFWPVWGAQSVPKNRASEAHILHTFKNTCNGHVKQYCREMGENLFSEYYQRP